MRRNRHPLALAVRRPSHATRRQWATLRLRAHLLTRALILIEWLLVCAIIAIVVAMATPDFLHARAFGAPSLPWGGFIR